MFTSEYNVSPKTVFLADLNFPNGIKCTYLKSKALMGLDGPNGINPLHYIHAF
jgi:hypothetical protein